ncbi:nSTAND1 domain-containing NTPase [Streptomyces sp. B21-108]|uniref:nSTAND1 domain-containing NTPase n=1 Tax=Streptomyces sp. B21-108 TaxID=3039419 RepID=UPI002FF43796
MAGRPESPLDPSAGPVARFAAELRKLRAAAGSPTYRVMAQRAGQGTSTLSQAAGGERLPTLPVVLAYVRACGGDPEEWEERWRQAAADVAAEPRAEDEDVEPPYRGLARFEPGDADLFFGRDELTDRLLALTRSRRFSAVFGPSGSGKSSLLRAGLIPRLRNPDQAIPQPAALRVLTPGEHPLRTHEQRLAPKDGDGDTWLIVDQFEELYTLCHDPAERDQFIDHLLTATDPGSRLRVVIAVRADFLGRCAEHPALTEALQDGTVLAGPMSRDDLRQAIVKPAQAAGLIVERELTTRILDEVQGEPGALPLMSHALLETWRRRRGRALTRDAYESAGGLHGAIARTAEDIHTCLTPAQAGLARRILLRLVTPGDGAPDTRRPAHRQEFDFGSPTDTATVIEQLARARLLTLDDDRVDLAHEVLITAWPRLRGWIEDDRHRLRVLRQLTEAAAAWRELGRDPGALYRGTRLAEATEAFPNAERTRELTAVESDFLTTSMDARTRERRRLRGLVSSMSVLLVLALVAGAVAWQQHRTSEQQHLAAAARRAATAAAGLRTTDPRTALRLSVAAWRLSHTPETRSALIGALAQHDLPTFTPPGAADVDQLSPDGRTLIRSGAGTISRWDLGTRRRTDSHRLPDGADDPLGAADISPDGRYVAVPVTHDDTMDMRVRLWDTRTHQYHGSALGPSGSFLSALPSMPWHSDEGPDAPVEDTRGWSGFSADGHDMFFAVGDRLEVWSGESGRRLFTLTSPVLSGSTGGDISPDHRLVALCTQGSVSVWDVGSHHRTDTAWHSRTACGNEADLQFAPDGRTLALLDATGLRRLTVGTGRQLPRLRQVSPLGYAFSEDGKLLAGWGSDDIRLWRLDHPEAPVFSHPLTDVRPSDLRIDTAARVLRYTTQESGARTVVHSLDIATASEPRWNDHAVATATLSANGAVLAVLNSRGKAASGPRVFDGRTGRLRYEVAAAGPPPTSATFEGNDPTVMSLSADGRRLAFGSGPADPLGDPTHITVWDTVRNRRLADIRPYHGDRFLAGLILSPDGRELMTTDAADASVTVWDADNGRKLRVVHRPDTGDGAGTGDYISAVSGDGGVLLTDAGTLLPADGQGRRWTMQDCPCVSALSPDGSRVAFADTDGGITLWDARRATSLGVMPGGFFGNSTGEDEEPTVLAFSPDGSTLAAAGSHGTLRLWDVTSRQRLGTDLPTAGDEIVSLAFSGDGGSLYAAGTHVPVQHFDLAPADVSRSACRRAGGTLSRDEWRMYLADVPYRSVC